MLNTRNSHFFILNVNVPTLFLKGLNLMPYIEREHKYYTFAFISHKLYPQHWTSVLIYTEYCKADSDIKSIRFSHFIKILTL